MHRSGLDEPDDDVHHVGSRHAGAQQRAGGRERVMRVVGRQRSRGIQPALDDGVPRTVIDERTGRVGGAVATIGAGGEQADSLRVVAGVVQRSRCGERELLTTSAGGAAAGAAVPCGRAGSQPAPA